MPQLVAIYIKYMHALSMNWTKQLGCTIPYHPTTLNCVRRSNQTKTMFIKSQDLAIKFKRQNNLFERDAKLKKTGTVQDSCKKSNNITISSLKIN